MDRSSYLLALLSVWVGLGLGQLVQAFDRIARFGGEVKWDWLPLTWAGFAFLMVVQVWWAYFTLLQAPLWTNLFAFLLPLAAFVILYLICASALPDVRSLAKGEPLDLEAFYFSQHRYFFGLWSALLAVAVIVSRLATGRLDPVGEDGFRAGAIVAGIAMAATSRRSVHVAITLLAILSLAVFIALFTRTLG